jgi:RNA polymerase sigma-70 factor (ECF subfamily)
MVQEHLVELIYKKDENSFTVLYDLYAKSLFGIIASQVKDSERAEKMLTEVFADAWNSLDSYVESKGRFFSWLVEITHVHISDYLKTVDEHSSYKSNSFIDLLADENTPETIGIQEYVRKLKPRSIKIIDLLFFKGCTVSEVAEKLDINPDILALQNKASVTEVRNLLEA